MNPFNFEKLAANHNFCGRVAESKKLKALVMDQKNVLLYGDRRYGKSSLIHYVYADLPKSVIAAYIDIYDSVDAYDFAVALYRGIIRALPFDLQAKAKEIVSLFSRIELSLTPHEDGTISLLPAPTSRDFDTLIEDALKGAQKACDKHNKTMVIAIDEFQQIATIKDKRIDALLRKYMQSLPSVSFIFSGSKKHILSGLFLDNSKPLYGMATSISLAGIENDVLYDFCNERLDGRLDGEAFSALYTLVRGQTKLIMQTCYWLYESEENVLDFTVIRTIVNELIDEKNEEFRMLFNTFTGLRKKALKLIAYTAGVKVFDGEALQQFNISAQQLQQPLVDLCKTNDITKLDSGVYEIADVHFSLWCLREFGKP